MSNMNRLAGGDDENRPTDIRSIREVNGEIEDGPCDVLVFNDVSNKSRFKTSLLNTRWSIECKLISFFCSLKQDVYYPLINIDPKSIIKPSVINIKPNEVFIENETSSFKKAYFKWRSEGLCSALEFLSALPTTTSRGENGEEVGESFGKTFFRAFAHYLLLIWCKLLLVYVYFYPYALLSEDELCEKFCKFNNFKGVIRHIVWHPRKHKVALALSNDNVYIYSSNLVTPLLKHPFQKKITDIKWSPTNENQLTIACARCIIKWNIDTKEKSVRLPIKCAEILKDDFSFPITRIDYTSNGNYLLVSSPSSSKILWIYQGAKPASNATGAPLRPNVSAVHNDSRLLLNRSTATTSEPPRSEEAKNDFQIISQKSPANSVAVVNENKSLRMFASTITYFSMSPDDSRVCVGSTEFGVRVYETENFTCKNWARELKAISKCACWNQTNGRILLFAMESLPKVYAIIFYDKAESNYVGGTNTYIPVLDVKETELESGVKVGGSVQNIVWDQNCERLILAFVENPHYLAVYRTKIKPSLEITSIGFIHGLREELPLCYSFHYAFKSGALLTVCWSSGYVSHIPLQYNQNEKANKTMNRSQFNRSQFNATNVRSLTSFCMNQIMSDENTSFIQPNTSTMNVTKKYLTQDSVISPRKPMLFTSFNENQENDSLDN